MQNKPSTFRFSLRALFMVTAFVGLGLLALMYPLHWVPFAITLAVAFLFAYSIVAVLASKGSRRLFWAAFAATAAAILLLSENIFSQFLPHDWTTSIFLQLHPTDEMGVQNRDADMGFVQTVNRLPHGATASSEYFDCMRICSVPVKTKMSSLTGGMMRKS